MKIQLRFDFKTYLRIWFEASVFPTNPECLCLKQMLVHVDNEASINQTALELSTRSRVPEEEEEEEEEESDP